MHTNPDGDTLGAATALKLALKQFGKTVEIFCEESAGEKLCSAFEELCDIRTTFGGKFDLFVAVDCGDLKKIGVLADTYSAFLETLTIDHHGCEYYSKYNLLKNSASTCQIVYEVVQQLHAEIDARLATYLYMGLCTDTGNFSHNSTNEDAFLMAADMCRYGADIERVNRVFFKDSSLPATKLLGRAINNLRMFFDGKMALMYLSRRDLQECGACVADTSGIVQAAIDIDTAKIGVMMTEYAANTYKVSMRGKDFAVRDICRDFGGGGHLYASGCVICGFLEDVIEKIVRAVGFEI